MVFSSVSFIFAFLPCFLLLDHVLKGKLRNVLLILASLLFYIWGEGFGVLVLALFCLINLGLGKLVAPPPLIY